MLARFSLAYRVLIAPVVIAMSGCAAGDDGKLAAVQSALDAKPVTITVPNGKSCHRDAYWRNTAPHVFTGLPYVSIKPSGIQSGIMGPEPCTTVTWAKSAKVTAEIGNDETGFLPVGHLVVDKIGEEQDGTNGVKATPFRSHFEWFPAGEDMHARHLAQPVNQPADEEVDLTKDADGKWVARIIIV